MCPCSNHRFQSMCPPALTFLLNDFMKGNVLNRDTNIVSTSIWMPAFVAYRCCSLVLTPATCMPVDQLERRDAAYKALTFL